MKRHFPIALAVGALAAAAAPAMAQNFLDTFDDGDDAGWTRYNPFNGRVGFDGGAYRMYVPASTDPQVRTYIGSAAPDRARVYENFTISVDVLAETTLPGSACFVAFRHDLNLTGYGLIFDVFETAEGTRAQIVFNRFVNGTGFALASAPDVPAIPGDQYRLTVTCNGPDMVATLARLADLSTPLSVLNASNSTYSFNHCSLWGAYWALSPESDKDVTFDNFKVVGCRADFNANGQADFFDYLDFVAAFDAEDLSADFNFDGQVDFFDYLDFAAAFDAGCD